MLSASPASPELSLDAQDYDPTSILVRFKPGAAATNAADILPGASNGRAYSLVPGLRSVRLGPGQSVEAALHVFRSNPNVIYAEPNGRVQVSLVPNDDLYPSLYGMEKIDAPEAWDIATGDTSVLVAVIDTGIDYTHPDLAANIWTNPGEIAGNGVDDDGNGYVDDVHGYDFVGWEYGYGDGDPLDDFFHGTHVAGTIGAVGNNAEGVVGVNWNAKIAAVKFLDSGGGGSWEGAIAAIQYAVAIGANISNNSWGGTEFSAALHDAIAAARDAGHLFVAAAGNNYSNGDSSPSYPAGYSVDRIVDGITYEGLDNIIAVAATDSGDNKADFSNWGLSSVHLGAPGVGIYSTFPTYETEAMYWNGFATNYETISGTSMATPHVAGVAALAWGLAGSSNYAEIKSAILSSVDPVSSLATTGPTPVATGGRLNAFKTLQAVGMSIAGSTPAAGSIIAATSTDFAVNFSHPYDPATIDDPDLTVNGIAPTSHTFTDSDTVTFHFATSPVTAQGLQTMHMAAGAVSAASAAGLPDPLLHEWTATFRYDLERMEVVSTSPAGPLAGVPLTKLDINLNEAVDPLSVSTSDLALSLGWVTGVEVLPGNTTIRFTLAGITEEGSLDVGLAAGAFTDEFGNPSLPYSADFTLVTGMGVGGSTPAAGNIILGLSTPSEYVVHFTLPYDADTVDAGDLTVNGIAATSRTLTDSDTVTFHFAASPVTIQGEQTMHIAAGALNADPGAGLPDPAIQEWTGLFRWDQAPMEVTSTSPASSSNVLLPFTTLDVNLNEAVQPSSVQTSDLQLSQGSAMGFTLENGGATIRFTLSGITSEGTLSASIAAGALADTYGNPNLAFAGSFTLDIGTVPFPTPLAPVAPLGSLIQSQVAAGIIGVAGDTDSFTIDVAAGQTITVLVTPASTLQPTVAIGGTSASGSAPGKKALLQTVAAGGLQTIAVGALGGTTGGYTVQVLLDTALETESHDGAGNNTTPQNIDGSFITVATTTVSADRGAVMGRTDGNPTVTLLAANFETTTGDNNWTIDTGTNNLWHNSIGHRYDAGHSATHSMYFGAGEKYVKKGNKPETFTEGTYEVTKKGKGGGAQVAAGTITSPNIALATGGQISVDFNYLLQTQSAAGLDVAELQIKPIGSSAWTTLATYNAVAESSTWIAASTVDISTFAGQTVQLRFSFDTVTAQDNKFEGWYVDDVVVRQTTPHDNYSFHVEAGERVTVALQAAGDVNVLLQDSGGATLAAGSSGAVNLRKMINNFGPLTAGTYRLAITGQTNTPYTLVVLRDASFDAESNDSYATAQDYTGVPGVLGHVTAGSDLFSLRGTPVSGGLVLAGSKMTLGIATDGSFITGGAGIQFLGNEFVIPGSPVAGFTIGQNGSNYTNKEALGTTDIPVSLEDLSLGTFRGVRIVGNVGGGLQLERVIAFSQDDEFATIATRLTNTSGGTIDNVAWLENLDPDQGEPLGFGFETYNDVVLGGQFVRADAAEGLTIGLGSADARRVVSAQGFDNRDPFEIINSPVDPDGLWEDIGINLAFNFGSLAPGQMAAGSMLMTFGRTTAEAEATYTAHTGGTLVADEDWYKQTVGADGILHVETSTPGDAPGEPGNALNPRIEVYSTSATAPVYLGTPLADGRNEVVHVTGLVPGTIYRIRVSAEGGTGGAYFLDPPPAGAGDSNQAALAASPSLAGSALLTSLAAQEGDDADADDHKLPIPDDAAWSAAGVRP
ncbi:MAG TPA: S8 family peptidase, partial [Pirellulaceae bacterium]|nr:S8 family peptidase [Pirellulaceae bacterium]